MRFEIAAEASAALLCRLIGFAAQLDLVVTDMEVRTAGEAMAVWLVLDGVDERVGAILAEKMRRCIGVTAVTAEAAQATG